MRNLTASRAIYEPVALNVTRDSIRAHPGHGGTERCRQVRLLLTNLKQPPHKGIVSLEWDLLAPRGRTEFHQLRQPMLGPCQIGRSRTGTSVPP